MIRGMSARQLAESPPDDRGPASPRRGGEPRGGERAPTLAERYRSLFVLGRGGMGSVEAALEIGPEHAASEPDASYQRVVALKRLLPDAARDARRSEMFLREARVAAMLDHPNVVRAFDYGEIDGELYLAMEYVEGQPLSRVLRKTADAKERLSPSLVAHILAEVCHGLHAAHDLADASGQPLHLVHRDVSPQNVMLGYDGRVRLLDFGVAKIETESVTKTGEVKGKTAYMSPEQAMGEALDRRSDLFGVGAILYECLALERMWGDGTDMEMIRKLALESPPPLERADPSAPPALQSLYDKLVARDAKDRPATAGEAADGLAAVAKADIERSSRSTSRRKHRRDTAA
jgi:eukaryotic-like serine/threonine-protein kinase